MELFDQDAYGKDAYADPYLDAGARSCLLPAVEAGLYGDSRVS